MASPTDRKYTKTHEWVSIDGDVATIGITDFAQSELGDITYLELPAVGETISAEQAFGVIESVKAANDVFSPLDGEVVARNEDAVLAPETINASPFDRAWLVRVKVGDTGQIAGLMAANEYDAYAESAGH